MVFYFSSLLELWMGRDMVVSGQNIPLFTTNSSCLFPSPQPGREIVCDQDPLEQEGAGAREEAGGSPWVRVRLEQDWAHCAPSDSSCGSAELLQSLWDLTPGMLVSGVTESQERVDVFPRGSLSSNQLESTRCIHQQNRRCPSQDESPHLSTAQ